MATVNREQQIAQAEEILGDRLQTAASSRGFSSATI